MYVAGHRQQQRNATPIASQFELSHCQVDKCQVISLGNDSCSQHRQEQVVSRMYCSGAGSKQALLCLLCAAYWLSLSIIASDCHESSSLLAEQVVPQ